jgi:23S rRNA pseudouridine1911/1915/1917 synthase
LASDSDSTSSAASSSVSPGCGGTVGLSDAARPAGVATPLEGGLSAPLNARSAQPVGTVVEVDTVIENVSQPRWIQEDGPLLVVHKPAGWLTQGVPAGIPNVVDWAKQQLKQRYAKPGNVYLGIPHRLDRPVSGVMVFARNSKAAARLAEQFRNRQVQKRYLCLVTGTNIPDSGSLTDWLLKDAAAAHVTVVTADTSGAKLAELRYRTLHTNESQSLIEVELLTGRMHQIRVQLAAQGWPIVGDRQYGGVPWPWPVTSVPGSAPTLSTSPDAATESEPSEADGDRLEPIERVEQIALHAYRLELLHPIRYDAVSYTVLPPTNWPEWARTAAQPLSSTTPYTPQPFPMP